MIAYEIQLQCVIRDKIQSETESSLRQNSIRDRIQSETKFSPRKNLRKYFLFKKILSEKICLRFPERKVSCLEQIDAYHKNKKLIRNKSFVHKDIVLP